jgi:hypothetical protein
MSSPPGPRKTASLQPLVGRFRGARGSRRAHHGLARPLHAGRRLGGARARRCEPPLRRRGARLRRKGRRCLPSVSQRSHPVPGGRARTVPLRMASARSRPRIRSSSEASGRSPRPRAASPPDTAARSSFAPWGERTREASSGVERLTTFDAESNEVSRPSTAGIRNVAGSRTTTFGVQEGCWKARNETWQTTPH